MPFSGYFSTADPDMTSRQERQIVQSELNLDGFLLEFTPSGRHLISVRSVIHLHPGPCFCYAVPSFALLRS